MYNKKPTRNVYKTYKSNRKTTNLWIYLNWKRNVGLFFSGNAISPYVMITGNERIPQIIQHVSCWNIYTAQEFIICVVSSVPFLSIINSLNISNVKGPIWSVKKLPNALIKASVTSTYWITLYSVLKILGEYTIVFEILFGWCRSL